MQELYNKKAEIFKALSNPIRLEIIDLLLNGEICVSEIQEKLNKYEQPHISKNLSKLKHVGLIKDKKVGLKVYYSLKITCLSTFMNCLKTY